MTVLPLIPSLEKTLSKAVSITLKDASLTVTDYLFLKCETEDPFAGQAFPTASSGFDKDPFAGDPFGSQPAKSGSDAFDPFGALSIPPVSSS
jgi:hypothetical protein